MICHFNNRFYVDRVPSAVLPALKNRGHRICRKIYLRKRRQRLYVAVDSTPQCLPVFLVRKHNKQTLFYSPVATSSYLAESDDVAVVVSAGKSRISITKGKKEKSGARNGKQKNYSFHMQPLQIKKSAPKE